MKRFTFMLKLFWRQPWWFRALILVALAASIVFSSSYFADEPLYDRISKGAAAIFFLAFAVNLRRSQQVSIVFYVLSALCIYLALA